MKTIFNFRGYQMLTAQAQPLLAEWLAALQASGYRLTGARRVIVEIVANSCRALEPLEIFEHGRRAHPGLGLVTVYRTLEKLEALGLAQRVHQPGGCNMYLRASQAHEHLLLCTSCGLAQYFSGDDLTGLIAAIGADSRFVIQDHWLQLLGVCPACQSGAAGTERG
jgi:Fur family ferric uptake transcriptional regulator